MSGYETQWAAMLQDTGRTVDQVASKCSFAFAALVRKEFEKFKRLHVPKDDFEWETRQKMQINLVAKISSIAGADRIAQQNRKSSSKVFHATQSFCEHVSLDDDVATQGISFASEISQLAAGL